MSFEKGSELLEKFMDIEVSSSLIRSITEEAGEKVFQSDIKRASKTYEHPERVVPTLLESEKKKGVLYIMTDGSAVNTIHKDKEGKTWKEMIFRNFRQCCDFSA